MIDIEEQTEIVRLMERIEDAAAGLQVALHDLDPDEPQSFANDFSEPLCIAEEIISYCTKLMEAAE